MKQLEIIVPNPTGLHARPAKTFVKTAKQFKSKIKVQHGKKEVNAKSVISVLTLGVEKGGEICITADGPDEDEALAVLKEAIESGLGDELGPNGHGEQPAKKEPDVKPASPAKSEPAPAAAAPPITADSGERTLRGIPAATGIAVGPLHQFQQVAIEVKQEAAADPAEEKAQLEAAIKTAKAALEAVHEQMLKRIGEEEAAIFEAHLEILEDPDLFEAAAENIDNGQNAGQGWQAAVEDMAKTLASVKDELLAARATDIRDVGNRVLRALTGDEDSGPSLPDEPVILVATDLTPSDTVTLDPARVLGFCTATGGANGHTAILARALGIPAIVGAGNGVLALQNGLQAILNGDTGALTLNPDDATLTAAKDVQQEHEARRAAELEAAHQPAITKDEHRLEIVANIGSLADAEQAPDFGAEGVGLLRTEFLFLERAEAPTEDEQFEVYRDIALALKGQPVIIRTLDIGGDKPLPYLSLPKEENPFLGQRGIRLCLARPELLRTQIRAILRAAEYGHLRVMFPMITNFEDWVAARKLVEEVRAEMKGPKIELGIMVEVPAAALLAEVFAREVDFFSIGTNDLTQYTLAMDRTNPLMSDHADGLNPAVLHLIKRTVDAAHANGKWVGVCGELGADTQAVPILVGLGVDELSVSVPAVPAVKAQIRKLTRLTAQHLAAQALECATATEVRRTVHSLKGFAGDGKGVGSDE